MQLRSLLGGLCAPMVLGWFVLSFGAACGTKSNDSTANDANNTSSNSNNSSGNSNTTCVAPAAVTAAAATPPACQHTMFAKYQLAGFGAVNNAIVTYALDTNKVADIGTSFQDKLAHATTARQTEFTNNLAAFLIDAYGNASDPNYVAYTGPTMLAAHADLKITASQYSKFISEVVVPALTVVGVSSDPATGDIANCFAPQVTDPNFVANFVTCQ